MRSLTWSVQEEAINYKQIKNKYMYLYFVLVPTMTNYVFCEKKEEIWLSPMTKAPTPTEMSKGKSDNTNNATKKFD